MSCAHAGGLFHFRKGQGTYSIDPADYPEKPLYAAAPDNKLLNEFFLLVLLDVHEWQSLGALQFTSDEPHFVKELIEQVYPEIPSTPYAPALPETRVFPTLSEDEVGTELIAPDGEGGASVGDK